MTADAFFKELKRIILTHPKPPSYIEKSENCEYCNHVYYSKNLIYCFDSLNCTDSLYLYDSYMCANSIDCDYGVEGQLCYECSDPFKCFNCDYLENCTFMRDSGYCYNCNNCQNVFGCVDLNNKSFCLFNRQLEEGEYREQVKKYQSCPPEKILQIVGDLKKRFPWTQTNEGNNSNTAYGNYMFYNKNCYFLFDASHNEDCAYLFDSFYTKNCLDAAYSGKGNELCYEVVDVDTSYNCDFMIYNDYCQDSSFCINSTGLKNCLGCVGLSQKQYCILNRQFTKEEYEQISTQIKQELKEKNLGWNDLIF